MGSPPFLITGPHGSLGCLWLVGGQCYKARVIVPCCQRLPGPAGSQTGCVCMCVCVFAKANILLTLSRLFSVDGMLQACSKKHFQNICKPKWLQIFEQADMKGWLPNQWRSRKAVWDPPRLVKWAIPHAFTNIFKCIFLIWSSSCMFMPPPE